MDIQPALPPDLYRGTADYYDRYRPAYPSALLDELCERLPLPGAGRLLDLACGTGQVALPLAGRFAEVVAVDQEREAVAFGRAKAQATGQRRIRWIAGAAESVDVDGCFALITVGTAFHRLDRRVVAGRMFSWLEPGGVAALLWSAMPSQGGAPWQQALGDLMEAWMARVGTTERVPPRWLHEMRRVPHLTVLVNAGFVHPETMEVSSEQRWTAGTLTGFMYSTSILNRNALGEHAEALERDLASLVDAYGSGGTVTADARYTCQLARKPT